MAKEGGGLPRFEVKQDVAQTMNQMMQALMARVPRGVGQGQIGGAGGGAGGSGDDGYSVAGNSVNVPLYGPDRTNYSQSSNVTGTCASSVHSQSTAKNNQEKGKIKPKNQQDTTDSKLAPENIPARYKQAVKRYFSQESENQ